MISEELREYFLTGARSRVDEMRDLLARLTGDTHDAAAFELLGKHFHWMAGLGGTYGFARISKLGDEAEAAIIPMRRAGAFPSESDTAAWSAIVDGIAAELC
jgi:hypothetical protein